MIESILSAGGSKVSIKNIQRFTLGSGTPSGAFFDIQIDSVDTQKSVIFTESLITSNNSSRIAAQFLNPTTIRVYNRFNSSNVSWITSQVTVVEFKGGVNIQSGSKTLSNGFPGQTSVTINPVDPSKSMVFVSYRNTTNLNPNGSANAAVVNVNQSSLNILMQISDSSVTFDAFWWVVEFK